MSPTVSSRRALTLGNVLGLQGLAGNKAVSGMVAQRAPVVQRELAQGPKVGEEPLAEAGGLPQPGAALEAEQGSPQVSTNEFGEMDGKVETGVRTHAFSNGGKTGTAKWHHAQGPNGGTGYPPGAPTLVAPVYESSAPVGTDPAKAWIKKGTGTVKVNTWFIGVPAGDNGPAKWDGYGGLVYIAGTAVTRMDTHERGHSNESRRLHDHHIVPLEKRVASYRQRPSGAAAPKTMSGATEAAAKQALQTHVNWNPSVNAFINDDLAANQPMGTWDTTDQAKADFYHDHGAKKIAGVDYDHHIKAP